MLFEIPVGEGVEAFSEAVELNGKVYDLLFHFNRRDDHWRLTLAQSGVVLLRGIKLVQGRNVLGAFRYKRDLPPGELIVHDQEGGSADPGATGFGDRVLLLYREVS